MRTITGRGAIDFASARVAPARNGATRALKGGASTTDNQYAVHGRARARLPKDDYETGAGCFMGSTTDIRSIGPADKADPAPKRAVATDIHPVGAKAGDDADGGSATLPPGGGPRGGAAQETGVLTSLGERVTRLEKQNRRLKYVVILLVLGLGYVFSEDFLSTHVIVHQTLMESKELKLLDNNGNARLFLRMYSKVPVIQLLDRNGKPRLSLGLRFDDTPFIDLSDKTGRTRATLELTHDDSPTLRLFDAHGDTTFKIK